MTKILLIANPKSGTINFDNAINTVNMYFKNFSVESTLIKTEYNGHAVDIVKNQNLTNFDSVCAMGGPAPLGLLPPPQTPHRCWPWMTSSPSALK